MKLPVIEDSRGNPSQTLFFTVIAVSIVLVWGVSAIVAAVMGMPILTINDFTLAFTTAIAPWVAREAVEKVASSGVAKANIEAGNPLANLPPGA